ncbi:PepSY domain-containing protein [Arthrobacter sp. B1805]|uniref:PepSY domain-containing protein n=1 Tax=Arthrobacter sp. B1805 TaxID=2058892 RepID=UPI000CE4527D|nr:PepSY domain-containing protein [Arthrobacter sp. B1805]
MNVIQKKKAIVGSLAGLVLVSGTALGGVAVANANSGTPSPGTTQSEQGEQQEAKVTGSISVPESGTEVPDAEEAAQLAKLATIDTKAAEAAATASVPGSSVVSTELGDEDGFLVYDVSVKDGAGTVTEVKVDAGNATVLASEAGDDEASEGPEGSEGDDNGADGEMNDAQEAAQSGADQSDDNGADGEMNDAQEATQDAANGK